MKFKFWSVFFLMFLLHTFAKGQTAEKIVITDPKSYKDYIFSHLKLIEEEVVSLFNVIYHDSATSKEEALAQKEKTLNLVINSRNTLRVLQPIEPDFELKTASLRLITFHKYVLEKSYTEYINIIYSENPDLERLEYIIDHILVDEAYFDNTLKEALDAFNLHYDISIFD